MKLLDLKNNPKQLRNTLIITGSIVTGFSLTILSLGLIGASVNKQNDAKTEVIYKNVVQFMNESPKTISDPIVDVLSFTYSEKTRRLMLSGVGNTSIFDYDVSLNQQMSLSSVMEWLYKKGYQNSSFVENTSKVYSPYNHKLKYPTCESITYLTYEGDSINHVYYTSGTFHVDNDFYSFTDYVLDEEFTIKNSELKFKVSKTNSLAYNFFKLIMQ